MKVAPMALSYGDRKVKWLSILFFFFVCLATIIHWMETTEKNILPK